MPIIAVANQKGGVGKTTTALNLGAALQEAGRRVLLLDLDPQGNLTVAAGVPDIDSVYPTVGDALMAARAGKGSIAGLERTIVRAPCGLDLAPANSSLSAAELGLVSALNRESALASLLRLIAGRYDDVVVDCLPSLGLLAINALRAADGVVIPVQADFLAIQGLAQMFETIAAVREQLNPGLAIYGVLLTLVDHRTSHSREVVRTVRSSLAGQVHVFDTEIRLQVAYKDSARAGRSILEQDRSGRAAEPYRDLARELMTLADARSARPRASIEPPAAREASQLIPVGASVPGGRTSAGVATFDAVKFDDFVEGYEQWFGSAPQ